MKRIMVSIIALAMVVSGCAGMSDSNRTKAEGTAVGAGGGALLGAVIGGLAGGSDGALIGAAVGAGTGAAVGYAYGTHVAKQKEKYAKTEDWLDACIASAEQVNQETRAYNLALETDIQTLQAETDSLTIAYAQKKVKKSALQKEKSKIDTKLAEANKKLDRSKFELENQQLATADARKGGQTQQADKLDQEIAQLKETVAELEAQTQSLASMSARMAV